MRKRVLISALAGIAADLSGCGKDADVLEYSFNRLEMAFFDECVFTEYFGSNGKVTLYIMVEGEKLWYYTNDDSYALWCLLLLKTVLKESIPPASLEMRSCIREI